MSRFIMPRQGVNGQNMVIDDGAKLFFYEVGTVTPKDTYTDAAKSIPSTNPVIADATGLFAYIEIDGSYDVVLKDKNGDQLWGPETIQELIDNSVTIITPELTTANMAANTNKVYAVGDVIITTEFSTGNDEGAIYDVVLTSAVTPNGTTIIIGTADALISFVAREGMNLAPNGVVIGYGIKNGSQTNVGVEVNRDIATASTSWHGFNVSDYFAADTFALNPFGSDIMIGDGTQTTEVINHVNDFQCTDQIDLATGTLTLHTSFIAQNVLLSGTMSRSYGLNVIDPLGVRDTAGFGVPNFEDNGTATSNNFTGVHISSQHGTNHKSFHVTGPFTDGGSPQTSGGGEARFECQIISTEARASTSQTTGSIIMTGGLGFDGDMWGGQEINAKGAFPLFRLRDSSSVTQGFVSSGSSNVRLVNSLAGDLKFALSGTDVLELKSDRFIPSVTGALFLGAAANEWDTMFAQNASVISSDENLKTEITYENEALLDAWANVTPAWYKLKTAVTKKGSDEARIHSGYIAQQIEQSLSDAGIDGFKYGLLCKDAILETVTKTRTVQRPKMKTIETQVEKFELNESGVYVRLMEVETQEIQEVESVAVLDEDGNPVMVEGIESMVPMMRDNPTTEDYQEEYTEEEETGEFKLSLRYHECAVVESAYLRREIKRLIDNQS